MAQSFWIPLRWWRSESEVYFVSQSLTRTKWKHFHLRILHWSSTAHKALASKIRPPLNSTTTCLQYKTNDVTWKLNIWHMFGPNLITFCPWVSISKIFSEKHCQSLMRKMAEKNTFSAADYRSYMITVCVALGKSASEILNDACTLSQASAPSKVPVFRWMKHFSGRQLDFQDNRGKGWQNKTKCNDEIVAHVKAMINANARVSLQEIADCLGIDLSPVSMNRNKKLDYRKVSIRWFPPILIPGNKRDRLQRLCSKFSESVIQSTLTKLWQTMKHGYACTNLQGSLETKHGYWKVRILLKLLIDAALQRRFSIISAWFQLKKRCAAETLHTRRGLLQSSTGIQCFLRSRFFTWRLFSFCMMMHLLTRCIPCKSILQKRTLKLLPIPAYSRNLALWDFFLFPHLEKCPTGRSFKGWSALRTAVFQCLAHIPMESYRSACLQWIGRLEKCVVIEGESLKKLK